MKSDANQTQCIRKLYSSFFVCAIPEVKPALLHTAVIFKKQQLIAAKQHRNGEIMPIKKALLAAITRLKPDIRQAYKTQRVLEDISAKINLPKPRCRIDNLTATMKDGFALPLRVFTPLELDFTFANGLKITEDSRGTILFFHGGGWVNGTADFYIDTCSAMALRLERRVVSVDYRRAPEYHFPQAHEDCYEVARQLFAGMLLADVVPASITLFGDSAGANLAAGVSLMAASRGEFMPNTQMLLYPSTNFDHTAKSQFESIRTNGEDYLLTSRDIEGYMEMYQSCKQDRYNPWLAPLLSTSLAGQPRTLVITAEYCPLRDEGEAYAWRLQEAGCAVQCYRMADAIHGYLLYPSFFGIVKETYNIIRHFLDGDELKQEGGRAWLAIFGTALTT